MARRARVGTVDFRQSVVDRLVLLRLAVDAPVVVAVGEVARRSTKAVLVPSGPCEKVLEIL
jgi:hypothetical protein